MEFYRRFFKYHKASTQTILFILLFLLGFTSRFLPHPYNFSPISAIAIFSGFFFGWKKAFLLPIAMMFFSDLFLGFYQFNLMFTVYAALAISAIAGFFLRKNFHWRKVIWISFACSFFFFFTTNYAVWALTSWYEKSPSGLLACFLAALPFLRNTLLGDIFYTGSFFGIYSFLKTKRRIHIPSHFNVKNHEQSAFCLSK